MKIWQESWKLVREAVNNDDMDWLHIGIGRERTGKSSLAWQTCKMADPTFDVDRVAWNNPQMERLISTCDKGQALLYDEGQKGLYSREAMSANNKRFNKILMKSAGLNLIIYINTPSFLSLDWYVRKHRAMSLTKTIWTPMWKELPDGNKRLTLARGVFEFFDAGKFDQIYKDQKTQGIHYPAPTYVDTFPEVDRDDKDFWVEYRKRKDVFMKADEAGEDEL